jgi:26S proteasome regulatory subunit N9
MALFVYWCDVILQKVIEDVEKILDDADGITSVHGRYYLLASQFYRLQGKHADYYHTALRLVGWLFLFS